MKKEIKKTDNMLERAHLTKIKGRTISRSIRDAKACMTITKHTHGTRCRISFSNEIWIALNKPEYVDCYWWEDSLVMVGSDFGYLVAMHTTILDKDACICRFYLRSKFLFESIESKWNLSNANGRIYSGGKFIKSSLNGKPAVVISRTDTDYYCIDEESDGEL